MPTLIDPWEQALEKFFGNRENAFNWFTVPLMFSILSKIGIIIWVAFHSLLGYKIVTLSNFETDTLQEKDRLKFQLFHSNCSI